MKQAHLRVRDLMSQPVMSVLGTDTLGFAELAMKLTECRHLPVVDAEGRLVGVISARDALRAHAREPKLPRVDSMMRRAPVTVRPHTSAEHAVDLMLEHGIGCLPVVDEEGRPIGIVTETDFMVVAKHALEGSGIARRARA